MPPSLSFPLWDDHCIVLEGEPRNFDVRGMERGIDRVGMDLSHMAEPVRDWYRMALVLDRNSDRRDWVERIAREE
jgi:hypothetical protein